MAMPQKGLKNAKDNEPPARIEDLPPQAAAEDESNWLVSYADMMTLLCGFFIMMFSMAKLDEPQYEVVREAVAKQFGGEYVPPAQEAARFMTQFIEETQLKGVVDLKMDRLGISVIFRSTMFFDSMSAELRPEGREVLEKLVDAIASRQKLENKEYRIVVEGHTDGRPILGGSFPSNWELSGARASRVVRTFVDRGFEPLRMTAIGYGDTRPITAERLADGSWDESALGKNRRVVVRILQPGMDMIPTPDPSDFRSPANAPDATPAPDMAPTAAPTGAVPESAATTEAATAQPAIPAR
jgi:chemotaxis protein MotB